MIVGAHAIVYSSDAEADRAFLRDVLGLPSVDVGQGWLIFGLPPSEVAVHPSEEGDSQELYLMCDDVEAFVAEMRERGMDCEPPEDHGWGVLTHLILPGGNRIGVYEPRHERPPAAGVAGARRGRAATRPAGRPKRPAAKKRAAKARPATRARPAAKSRAKKKAARRPRARR